MRRVIILAAVLLWSFQVVAAADAPTTQDAFTELNTVSREAYGASKNEVIAPDQAIFLVTDKVTLIRGTELGSLPLLPPVYDELKDISHLQLGIYGAVTGLIKHQGTQPWIDRLTALRTAGLAAKSALPGSLFNDAQRIRQATFIDQSIAFLDDVLSRRSSSMEALTAYMRATTPAILANVNDAAIAQIDMLDKAVKELSKQLSEEEFANAIAVLTGPKMPRVDFLPSQYFAFAFNEDLATSKRIVYVENIYDAEGALAVLRTFLNDRRMSEVAYGDANRLERDLLGDAATAELLRRFGKLGPAQNQ
ncbi:hypothetical protein [Aestuariivirga sp.]|jgi:hypothetical protein|uniref:hypothetical protein n=1 Tax=Aestuariivirga sp. TaxID=2650926 RepID=UPI0037847556